MKSPLSACSFPAAVFKAFFFPQQFQVSNFKLALLSAVHCFSQMPKGNGKDSFRVSLSSSSESESPEPRAAEPGPNASDSGPSSSSEELHVAVPERGRRRRSPVGESKGVEESKGSGKKGKSKTNQCRYCQKRLGAHESSREQHEWTNETCLRWQLWYRGYSWEEAERRAGALKEQRTSGVGEDPSQEERREKQRHKQERKDKKEKEKKKAKRPHVDPSPDPVRRRRRPRSSSEDSGEGPRKPREGQRERGAPRTLVINLPRYA